MAVPGSGMPVSPHGNQIRKVAAHPHSYTPPWIHPSAHRATLWGGGVRMFVVGEEDTGTASSSWRKAGEPRGH